MDCRILAFVLFTAIKGAGAYKIGAPEGVCLGLHTVHETYKHQSSEIPYKISFSSNTYTPSQEINVTLASPGGDDFKGFLIYGHRNAGDKERPVGEMTVFPTEIAQHRACVTDQLAGITHKNNVSITSLTFTWRAPANNVGDIVFRYMVVVNFETFWIDKTSDLLPAKEPLTEIPHVEQESFINPDINWDECGVSKGCFLYPRMCTGSDCSAAVTYKPDGDDFIFELFAANNEYAAVGFSNDKRMGRDHVHACTGASEQLTVQNGYNPYEYFSRTYRSGLSEMVVKAVDGNTVCSFRRPRVMDVFSGFWGNETFDLDRKYYLFLAWGSVYKNTDILSYHIELPVISEKMVDFHDLSVVRGSSLPLLTQIHATLMLIAWIVFVGLTTIISRFYKNLKDDSKICGAKYWFQIHRACGVIAWCLTAAAFVIIFVKVQALSKAAELHSYLGITVMAVCTLQVIAGMFRPDMESKLRPVFNIGHWFMGKGSHILAAVTIFFAYYSDIVPTKQREFGVITTGVWVGVQILWELIFETRRCHKSSSEKYKMSPNKKNSQTVSKSRTTSAFDNCLLFLYIVTVLVILTAQILAIFLF